MTQPLAYTSRLNRLFDWLEDDAVTRLWVACGAVMFAFLIVLTPAFFIDDRTLDGVNTWSKPIKFAFSLSLHAFTTALLAQLLIGKVRAGWTFSIVSLIGVLAILYEQIYITIQAARARRSHFNFETEFEAFMYSLMGLGAVSMIAVMFVLGGLIAFRGERGTSALRLGAVIGLIGGGILTLITAGYLSSQPSHWVGAATSDAAGLPIFGWSTEVGDLRVAHFVATHMIQTLPLLGFVLDRLKLPNAKTLVWIAAIVQTLIVIGAFAQALMGLPLIPLG